MIGVPSATPGDGVAIRPIETAYAGCRFRSRLEARWAVFFDALKIKWEYEPEGFETSAGRYLPDFRIELQFPFPVLTWFEVKPPLAPDDPRHQAFVDAGHYLTVARGLPRDCSSQGEHLVTMDPPTSLRHAQSVEFWSFANGTATTWPAGASARWQFDEDQFSAKLGLPRRVDPAISRVNRAYAAARSARFGT